MRGRVVSFSLLDYGLLCENFLIFFGRIEIFITPNQERYRNRDGNNSAKG